MNTKVENGNYKQPDRNMNAILIIDYSTPKKETDFPKDFHKAAEIVRLSANDYLHIFAVSFHPGAHFDVSYWIAAVREEGAPIRNAYWFESPGQSYSLLAPPIAWIELYPMPKKTP
jgi:hypothetical protein